MVEFEAKIKGIAVPVIEGSQHYKLWGNNKCLAYQGVDGLAYTIKFGFTVEIIGLSSEILKNEVLARKVVDNYHPIYDDRGYRDYYRWEEQFGCYTRPTSAFQSLLDKYNIVGEHLILERKDEK